MSNSSRNVRGDVSQVATRYGQVACLGSAGGAADIGEKAATIVIDVSCVQKMIDNARRANPKMSSAEIDAIIDVIIDNFVEHECAHCAGAEDEDDEESLMNRNGGNMTKEKPLKEPAKKQMTDTLRGVSGEVKK